jgi:hypothetical protein
MSIAGPTTVQTTMCRTLRLARRGAPAAMAASVSAGRADRAASIACVMAEIALAASSGGLRRRIPVSSTLDVTMRPSIRVIRSPCSPHRSPKICATGMRRVRNKVRTIKVPSPVSSMLERQSR